jgi:galactokinase
MSIQQRVIDAFQEHFDGQPTLIVRAPGRVNLIGEHTDYNDGFVLPMAINRATYFAARPRQDNFVYIYALDFEDYAEFNLTEMTKRHDHWAEYIKGTAWALQEAGHKLNGWEGVAAGDVPVAAGLSSSAALEMGAARLFCEVSGLDWNPREMAQLGQRTENLWIGVQSGIMDQMISAAGEQNHALLIDCRSLTWQAAPLPPETVVVVLDTATRRELVGSAYNERREQCETAAKHFGVPALRDVTVEQLEAARTQLDAVVYRRARHVVTENARTLAAAEAMRAGDASRLGELMNQSHVSMRDDFEISRSEMDRMVECAQAHAGSYGARMTGGGFGGCAVALVRESEAKSFTLDVADCYQKATGLVPSVYVCTATDGASIAPHPGSEN